MPLSGPLSQRLKRANFPLKSADGLVLWNELITAMETNLPQVVAEVKALQAGLEVGTFDDTFTINGIDFTPNRSEGAMLVGACYAALMADFDKYNTSGGLGVQQAALRVRRIAEAHGFVDESNVVLGPPDVHHGMATGLSTPGSLSFISDSSLVGAEAFGTKPDQTIIGNLAPLWNVLKQRRQGGRTHYVLAHLLNHQVNGSGSDPSNVIPFAATANTAMEQQVERHLKLLVHNAVSVRYTIAMAGPVGMTPGRALALAACTTPLQREIVTAEQYLPAALILTLEAKDDAGTWHALITNHRIDNIVPETVP